MAAHRPETCRVIAGTCRRRRWWRLPWELAATFIGLSIWLVCGSLYTLLGTPLRWLLPRDAGRTFGQNLLHHSFRMFLGFMRMAGLLVTDLTALARLRDLQGPLILAPNHAALWDAVFIISRLSRPVCVMKESILCNPLLGGGARLAGYIPGGHTTRMIRHAISTLTDGGQLLLFPEGTRTAPDAAWINSLKSGCALIAKRTGAPVYPVFIRSSSRFLEKGWPLWKLPVFPIHVSISLGEPLQVGAMESAQAFTARLQTVLEHELSQPHPLRRCS